MTTLFIGTPGMFIPDMQSLVTNAKDYGAIGNGISDDTTALQTAITATPSGGTLWLPTGTYLISKTLNITKPLTVTGVGWGSIIQIANSKNMYAFTFPGGTNGISGVKMRDFKIDCNGQNQSSAGGGINTDGAYECHFEELWIHNPWEAGIKLQNGPASNNSFGFHNTVRGCYIEGGQNAAGTGPGRGIWCSNSDENMIVNNSFWNNGNQNNANPCHILDDAGWQLIDGNQFVNGGVGVKTTSDRALIMNNTFDGVQGNNVVVTGNKVQIVGNKFVAIGHTLAANSISGVWLVGTTGHLVADNYFENDTSVSNATQYFVKVDNGTTFSNIDNNQFFVPSGSITAPVGLVAGQTNNAVRNNQGSNPIGSLVAPGIPSTGTPLTNNTGYDAMVLVTGGTVTNVAIGGTNTGQTSGWFRVPARQAITLTYLAAPSWAWYGD